MSWGHMIAGVQGTWRASKGTDNHAVQQAARRGILVERACPQLVSHPLLPPHRCSMLLPQWLTGRCGSRRSSVAASCTTSAVASEASRM